MVSSHLDFRAVVILGPTAVGKTWLAHQIFDSFSQEIGEKAALVNLDAFQIYKGIDIGTAKPSKAEIIKYNYHGIDICQPHENLDAQTFARLMHENCQKIWDQKKIPICVGGSGLYLRAFLHGLDQLPQRSENIREQIRKEAKKQGWPFCHQWLETVDPERAKELHPNDGVRIERALEIFLQTGVPLSQLLSKQKPLHLQPVLFPAFVIRCHREPQDLKDRIYKRVYQLIEQGWQEEVSQLKIEYAEKLLEFQSFKAIGYKTIFNNDEFNTSLLADKIAIETWHYAKKQVTWYAKEHTDYIVEKYNENEIQEILQEKNFKNILQR